MEQFVICEVCRKLITVKETRFKVLETIYAVCEECARKQEEKEDGTEQHGCQSN